VTKTATTKHYQKNGKEKAFIKGGGSKYINFSKRKNKNNPLHGGSRENAKRIGSTGGRRNGEKRVRSTRGE